MAETNAFMAVTYLEDRHGYVAAANVGYTRTEQPLIRASIICRSLITYRCSPTRIRQRIFDHERFFCFFFFFNQPFLIKKSIRKVTYYSLLTGLS